MKRLSELSALYLYKDLGEINRPTLHRCLADCQKQEKQSIPIWNNSLDPTLEPSLGYTLNPSLTADPFLDILLGIFFLMIFFYIFFRIPLVILQKVLFGEISRDTSNNTFLGPSLGSFCITSISTRKTTCLMPP